MTPEAKLLKSIVLELARMKAAGRCIWWVKLAGGPWQRPGLPDLAIVLDGRSIWLELKAPGKLATPLQDAMLRMLRGAGAVAEVVHTLDEAKKLLAGNSENLSDFCRSLLDTTPAI